MSLPPPLPPPLPPVPRALPPEEPRNRFAFIAGIIVVAAVIVIVVIMVVSPRTASFTSPGAPATPIPRQDDRADISASLAASKATDDPALLASVRQTLSAMGAAIQARDPNAADRFFDTERMMLEMERYPGATMLPAADRNAFITGMKAGLPAQISKGAMLPPWDRVVVRRILPVAGMPGEIVVYAKFYSGNDISRMRYWMCKTGGWRVYDFEDLDGSLRLSNLMGSLMGVAVSPNATASLKDIQAMTRAMNDVKQQDFDGADKEVKSINEKNLSPECVAVVCMVRTVVALRQGESGEAIKLADRALQITPDKFCCYLFKAIAHNDLRQYDQALPAAKKYIEMLGATGTGNYQLGRALIGLKRQTEAMVAIEAGLDDEPTSVDCLYLLASIETPAVRDKLRVRLQDASMDVMMFRTLCSALDRDGNSSAMAVVVDFAKPTIGDTVDYHFYEAAVNEYAKQYDKAAAGFFKDINTTDPYYKKAIFSRYLSCMVSAGKPLEGYEAAGRPEEAFAKLVNLLDNRSPAIAKLIDVHLAKCPKDSHAWDQKGMWSLGQEKYMQAVEAYDRAIATNTDAEKTKGIHARRMYAAYRGGKGLEMFSQYPDNIDRFNQLATLLSNDRRTAELRQLIDVHRAALPESPSIMLYEGELAYLNADYAGAVRILKKIAADKETRGDWQRRDRLVRAYCNLKQFALATSTAGDKPEERDSLHVVLIFAAQGDVPATEKAIDKAIEDDDYYSGDFLNDSDLGPLLKAPAFAKLHAKLSKPPATRPTTQPIED